MEHKFFRRADIRLCIKCRTKSESCFCSSEQHELENVGLEEKPQTQKCSFGKSDKSRKSYIDFATIRLISENPLSLTYIVQVRQMKKNYFFLDLSLCRTDPLFILGFAIFPGDVQSLIFGDDTLFSLPCNMALFIPHSHISQPWFHPWRSLISN